MAIAAKLIPGASFRRKLVALRQPLPLPVGALGAALGLGGVLLYAAGGYDRLMLSVWLAGIAVLFAYAWSISAPLASIARFDLVAPVALAVLFAPLYLARLFEWPEQVNSDEVVISQVADDYARREGVDPLGISYYLARPALLFVFWGKLAHLTGDAEFGQMRALHAVFGLLVVALSYALFRQLLTRGWAFVASCLLGVSHSFLMISRMAMRENTSVLIEVVALALLIVGLRNGHALATYAGGVVAGLGFYVYFPARAVFPIWIVALVLIGLVYRERFPWPAILRSGAVAALGFVLLAGPILISESKAPSTETRPNRETLLIYPEARVVQQNWVFASSVEEGMRTNIANGLTAFNNRVVDHGWIYEHRGFGFVDPLTGLLLWLGVGVVAFRLLRRRAGPPELLMVFGFLALWLSFAFVVNKAPNYTRMLIALPFVVFFVVEGVRALARLVGRALRHDSRAELIAARATVATALAALAIWNLAIAWDFVQDGRRDGDDIGTTGRYVYEHRDIPGQTFYLAADEAAYKYFDWGYATLWTQQLRLFAGDEAAVGPVLAPTVLPQFHASPPFVILMTKTLWHQHAPLLVERWPQVRLRRLVELPARELVAVEVPRR